MVYALRGTTPMTTTDDEDTTRAAYILCNLWRVSARSLWRVCGEIYGVFSDEFHVETLLQVQLAVRIM